MRVSLTDALHETIPNCHVTIATPYPEIDAHAYRSDETVPCSRRRPRRVMSMMIRAGIWNVAYRMFKKDLSGILDDEMRVYRRSDMVVDLSGDGLTEEFGAKCLFAHMVPIVLGKMLCKPVFVCAQTIGPFEKTLPICRFILKKADMVTAREKITFSYLTKLGLKDGSLSLAADTAFLLRPIPADKARELLEKEGVPFDKPLIGLSVSRLSGHVFGSEDSTKPTQFELEMADALDRIVAMGLRPVFVSNTTGPGLRRDDRRAASRIASLADSASEIKVLSGDYSPDELKGIIAQMDLFCGVRMHSCIAAMSSGVPTISIAYGPKAFGIMSLAGQERWILDIREVTADRLVALVGRAHEEQSAIRTSLQTQMPILFESARQNVQMIEQTISRNQEKIVQPVLR